MVKEAAAAGAASMRTARAAYEYTYILFYFADVLEHFVAEQSPLKFCFVVFLQRWSACDGRPMMARAVGTKGGGPTGRVGSTAESGQGTSAPSGSTGHLHASSLCAP